MKGREKIRRDLSYVVMANHQSLFDVWALIAKLPLQLRWVIRTGIRRMPVFGYALKRMGHIYIDRRSPRDTVRGLREAAREIRRGHSVVIFPEGTRSRDGRLQKFNRGGAVIALRSKAPVLPITVNGSRFVLPKGTLALMPGRIQIVVGDPIDPGNFSKDREEELLTSIRRAIEENLDPEYGSFV
ncbi:MAG: 1-acyl-sn-glycerol-3-phosphate acyltransferase [Deltaproteobacteria bacterium]|nr:1-acyl-sn-glycerol-3-phosphate acyltransferase [Deltaproteobacteria bacterium]